MFETACLLLIVNKNCDTGYSMKDNYINIRLTMLTLELVEADGIISCCSDIRPIWNTSAELQFACTRARSSQTVLALDPAVVNRIFFFFFFFTSFQSIK
jgi:hypothetical protein